MIDLCALGPLIQSRSTWASVAYSSLLRCRCAGMIPSIMTGSLSKLASYISKKLILERFEDLSWEWSSIIGRENPSSGSGIWAKNTRAMSQLPTLWDADQRCARTSMICQQKLRICHEWVSLCLILWHKYSISPSLFWLPNGIGEYAVWDLSRRYAQDSLVHRNLKHWPANAVAMRPISWHRYPISLSLSLCQSHLSIKTD